MKSKHHHGHQLNYRLMYRISYHNNTGFTLIELLVVISIIGLLSSVVLSSLSGARQSARITRVVSDMEQLQQALEQYKTDKGCYPGGGACPGDGYQIYGETNDGNGLEVLVDEGYLSSLPPVPNLTSNSDFLGTFTSALTVSTGVVMICETLMMSM